MMSSLSKLLHLVQLLVGNALGDPEVKAFLEEKRFPLDRLSEGKKLFDEAQGAVVRGEVARGRKMTLTRMLHEFFVGVREEMRQLRFALRTALRDRRDLLAKVGISIRLPRKGTAANGGPTGGAAAVKPEEAAARSKEPWSTVPRLVAGGRAMIQVTAEEPEVLAAVEAYGFTKESIEGLLARLDELERQDRDQEAAKGSGQAATSDLRAIERRVRNWYFPWRDRIQGAVRGKPELLVKLGLGA